MIWPNHLVFDFDYRMIYRMMKSFVNIGGHAAPQTPLLTQGASRPWPSDLHGEGIEPYRNIYELLMIISGPVEHVIRP